MQANAATTVIALLVLVIMSTAVDISGASSTGLSFAMVLIGTFAQLGVTLSALHAEGLRASGSPTRTASFVFALILISLGIAIGFVFLILPGIYLWTRWSLVAPLILGDGMRTSEAIRESWAQTRDLVAPISGALLVLSVPLLVFFGTLFLYPLHETPPIGLALIANLLGYGAQALIWNCSVAIYSLTRRSDIELAQVFA